MKALLRSLTPPLVWNALRGQRGEYLADLSRKALAGTVRREELLRIYQGIGHAPGVVSSVMDRISAHLPDLASVCEIGPGTGVYTAALREKYRGSYDILESDPVWSRYLVREYGVIAQDLTSTLDGYDFIHAHGVFTYIPVVASCEYLNAMTKCRGIVAFDYVPWDTFDLDRWLTSPHRYATPIDRAYIHTLFVSGGFELVDEFAKPWYPADTRYAVYRHT